MTFFAEITDRLLTSEEIADLLFQKSTEDIEAELGFKLYLEETTPAKSTSGNQVIRYTSEQSLPNYFNVFKELDNELHSKRPHTKTLYYTRNCCA